MAGGHAEGRGGSVGAIARLSDALSQFFAGCGIYRGRRGEYVAFLDADCLCAEECAAPLAALLEEEPELAIAALRVRSAGPGAIAAYERGLSPVDMGADRCRCGPGRRVAYVPSAAIVPRQLSALAQRALDIGAYAAGLWRGLQRDRRVRAVLPATGAPRAVRKLNRSALAAALGHGCPQAPIPRQPLPARRRRLEAGRP